MNKQQLLRDSDIEPTDEVVAEALGLAGAAFIKFIEGLRSHDIQVEWRYYNDGNAWLGKGAYKGTGVRGGQKEALVFWFSVWDGFFRLTFYFPERVRSEVLDLPLRDDVKKKITESKQMGEIRFFSLAFDLDSDELFHDIYMLADLRKMIT